MERTLDLPKQVPVHHLSSFDFDDAFSDGDGDDMTYQFSPDVVREELAGKFTATDPGTAEDVASNGFTSLQHVALSIVDTNASHSSCPKSHSPPSTPNSPESSGMSSHFSQISLADKQDIERADNYPHLDPYPNVIIDASTGFSSSNRISLTSALNSGPETVEDHCVTSFQSLRLPPPNTSQSTQSLPTPRITSHRRQPTQSSTATPTPAVSPSPSGFGFHSHLPPSASAPVSQSQPSQKPFSHRPTRSAGPSAFEKVRSKTRPNFLPPKPRHEDDKHMSDWESMMQQSRVAGQCAYRGRKADLLTQDAASGKKAKRSSRTPCSPRKPY